MISHREKLRFDFILTDIDVAGKKQLFEALALGFSDAANIESEKIQSCLMEQEQESSSGIGEGVAFPHIQMAGLPHAMSALIKLKKPMDFKGIDDMPVDIICCVASPEADGAHHLRRLSRFSRLLRDKDFCASIRETDDEDELQNLFMESQAQILMAA